MPTNLRVSKSRVRGPETAHHKAERDARVGELRASAQRHRDDADRRIADAERKMKALQRSKKSR